MVAWDKDSGDITPIDTTQTESTFGTVSLTVNSNKSVHLTLAGG